MEDRAEYIFPPLIFLSFFLITSFAQANENNEIEKFNGPVKIIRGSPIKNLLLQLEPRRPDGAPPKAKRKIGAIYTYYSNDSCEYPSHGIRNCVNKLDAKDFCNDVAGITKQLAWRHNHTNNIKVPYVFHKNINTNFHIKWENNECQVRISFFDPNSITSSNIEFNKGKVVAFGVGKNNEILISDINGLIIQENSRTGYPPLGYRPNGRTLVVEPAEAALVKTIFTAYLQEGNVRSLVAALAAQGLKNPARLTASGRTFGGGPFLRGPLYKLLNNPLYLGRIRHRDLVHDGQHEAIIDQATWDAIQALLQSNRQSHVRRRSTPSDNWLTGLMVDQSKTARPAQSKIVF